MFASALLIVAADLIAWFLIELACAVKDGEYTRSCDTHHPPLRSFAPLFGVACVLLGLALANRPHGRWIFRAGALAGIASGLFFLANR
jgi:hypothetical protein